MATKKRAQNGQEAAKPDLVTPDTFLTKIRELMAEHKLSIADLAKEMGLKSPGPIYRLLNGKGPVGPRLAVALARSLDREAVMTAYAQHSPRYASRARELMNLRARGTSGQRPRSLINWIDIDDIERSMNGDKTWVDATIASVVEPPASYDPRVRALICENVASGARYRYVTSSRGLWLDRFAARLEKEIGNEYDGQIDLFFDPGITSWSTLSQFAPILEVLSFAPPREPQAFLLVSKEFLKDEDECGFELDSRVAMKIYSEIRDHEALAVPISGEKSRKAEVGGRANRSAIRWIHVFQFKKGSLHESPTALDVIDRLPLDSAGK
jgi:transcriptional regulator with XRE-family HTH domain